MMHAPAEHFVPGPDTGRALRHALGSFGTGVTIVTVMSAEGPVGMTANSFSSVSLDPPLVLWSIDKASRRYQAFHEAEHMVIHVLSAQQQELCMAFARSSEPFGEMEPHLNVEGVPLLDGCLARFECSNYARYPGGDHTILLGEVLRVSVRPGKPLLFVQGAMGSFQGPDR